MKLKDMKPIEAVQFLNASDDFGVVVNQNRIRRWTQDLGPKVTTDKGNVDLIALTRYVASTWHRTASRHGDGLSENDRRVKAAREKRQSGRNIPPIPKCSNPKLRARCMKEFRPFLSIFPKLFPLGFSPDHELLISELESIISGGGKRVIAFPRGFGKTLLCSLAILWAALTGRHKMILLVANGEVEARQILEGLLTWLETSDELLKVFPEICHCIRHRGGANSKPLLDGEEMRMQFTDDLVFPYLPKTEDRKAVPGSECCIRVRGIKQKGIRGAQFLRADGVWARPTCVLIDDPQDNEVATQVNEIRRREDFITRVIEELRPPGQRMSLMMACTIIEIGDLAHLFSRSEVHPSYRALICRAMDGFPDDERSNPKRWKVARALWQEYIDIYKAEIEAGDEEHPEANRFYLANIEEMSKGALVRWPERFDETFVDAVQWLMTEKMLNPSKFQSEFQNDPEARFDTANYLDFAQMSMRFNGLRNSELPHNVVMLTGGIDIQQRILYWSVMGWREDMAGFVMDYGTFPDQPVKGFTSANAPVTYENWVRKQLDPDAAPLTWKECLVVALEYCLKNQILVDRGGMTPKVCMVDYMWNLSRWSVQQIAFKPEYQGLVYPDSGVSVTDQDQPISGREMRKTGNWRPTTDVEWYVRPARDGNPRNTIHDANFYRTVMQKGFATDPGEPGSLTFFGTQKNAELAKSLTQWYPERRQIRQREITQWRDKPGCTPADDHWADTFVQQRVAAEMQGLRDGAEVSARTVELLTKPVQFLDAGQLQQKAKRG